MEDTTIHNGLWWMPDDEGKQIPGTLISRPLKRHNHLIINIL